MPTVCLERVGTSPPVFESLDVPVDEKARRVRFFGSQQGQVQELVGVEDKVQGFRQIMAQYSDRAWEFDDQELRAVRVWKILIERMTCKQSGG